MKDKNWIINLIFIIIFGVIILFIWIMIGVLVFNKMHGIPEEYCSSSGGKWVFYECQEIPMSDVSCSDLKTGYWCEYGDGTSLNETGIWRIINSTT